MRLSVAEQQIILETLREYDPEARVFLFGSRTDDHAKGGDIDVLCLSSRLDRQGRRRARRALSDRLGGQRVDLVVSASESKLFVRMVLPDAVPLS
ncbi:MAG: nucleotidyltransferase domain-containing protein [Opitutales bacterium]|nr:nucleotidyltransferase domain-containing protein [Opitutales bacterium]